MTWLDDLQHRAVSARTAYESRRQRTAADATGVLGLLDVPTLVLHSRHERMNAFAQGRFLASHIPGARLVALESANHILLEDEPAWPVFLDEVTRFLATEDDVALPSSTPPVRRLLTPRELAVLSAASQGWDNARIAEHLTLSVRTVERHLQNIYAKLDLSGPAARTAAVGRLLREVED